MSVSMAKQALRNARGTLERCREKQAAEEKKAAFLEGEAARKERSAEQTRSPTTKATRLKEATKKRQDAGAARSRAAGHSTDAAKALGKVHDAEIKLRSAEAAEAKKADDKRRATQKRDELQRSRADAQREASHRREVDALRTRLDDQAEVLAARPWNQAPDVVSVLFITSSPQDQDGLRIDREMREIQQRVRSADFPDSIEFHYAVAAQAADLLGRLNEVKPDVVHFSGHSGHAGLALEDADGLTRVLDADELSALLRLGSRRIRLVVFNSCESAEHAAAAVQHLDAAIGMEQSIDDDAAKTFAAQFYNSIAFGTLLRSAFDQALLQVRLELGRESGQPQLHIADGLDAEKTYLVKPPGEQ